MTLDVRIERPRLALSGARPDGFPGRTRQVLRFARRLAEVPGPAVAALLPVSPEAAMYVVGVIEMVVGLALLGRLTRTRAWSRAPGCSRSRPTWS